MRNAALWVIAVAMVLLVGGGGAYWYIDEQRKSDRAEYARLDSLAQREISDAARITQAYRAMNDAREGYLRLIAKAEGAHSDIARMHAEQIDGLRAAVARLDVPACVDLTRLKLVNALKAGAQLAQYGSISGSSEYRSEKAKVDAGFVSFVQEAASACNAESLASQARVKDIAAKMQAYEAKR